jgi:hypothetical protein
MATPLDYTISYGQQYMNELMRAELYRLKYPNEASGYNEIINRLEQLKWCIEQSGGATDGLDPIPPKMQ